MIELSVPEGKYLESAYHLYADRLIPAIGEESVGRLAGLHRYLPERASRPRPSSRTWHRL